MPSTFVRALHSAVASLALAAACAAHVPPSTAVAPAPADRADAAPAAARDYLVLVASEAVDQIALVRFGPAGARVERVSTTGIMPADVDGPHGVAVSPDGKYYYVSTAHGTPYGFLWKYSVASDSLVGRVMLGNFPATLQVTPDGAFVYVVNFNLHGDMVPSSVSIVAADEMVEVARVPTCTMPHGSRIEPQGRRQYSACMMDDMAVEIDTRDLAVSRYFVAARGHEHGAQGSPAAVASTGPGTAHGTPAHAPASCSPTWVQPSADGSRIYVACNKSNDIVEVDVARWAMTRRLPAGDGVYNLTVTHDGRRLLATNKRGQSVSVFDLANGREVARIPTTRRIVHGVVASPDDRYAFVSQEGIGSEPGGVDVIDLRTLRRVASVDVGQQAGGIDFWTTVPAR